MRGLGPHTLRDILQPLGANGPTRSCDTAPRRPSRTLTRVQGVCVGRRVQMQTGMVSVHVSAEGVTVTAADGAVSKLAPGTHAVAAGAPAAREHDAQRRMAALVSHLATYVPHPLLVGRPTAR